MKKLIFIFLFFPVIAFGQIPSVGATQVWIETLAGNGLLTDLISAWGFDETSGTTAIDSHGSNDGTINGATINQTGKVGKCYSFDGVNDYVDIGNSLSSSSVGTIASWVYIPSFNSNTPIISASDADGSNNNLIDLQIREVSFNVSSTVGFVIRTGGSTRCAGVYGTTFSYSTWYHVGLVCDGSEYRLYLDGVEISFTVTNGTNDGQYWWDDVTETCEWNIASRSYGGRTKYVNGLIDQVLIYDAVKSDTEMEALYNSGNGLAYIDFTAFMKLKTEQFWQQILQTPQEIKTPLRIAS